MDKVEIERRKDVFAEWVTFIEDRVIDWKKSVPNEVSKSFDWHPDSLPIIEKYLVDNFTEADLNDKNKRYSLDAIISYVGDVFRKNIPETIWKIDVEDNTNIYYNLPYLVFKLGAPLCPHHLIKDALKEKTGENFAQLFKIMQNKWEQYKAHIESKSKK